MSAHRPGFWQVAGSVSAALFGVQSERNRQRDFTHGRGVHYVVMGLALTALFVLAVSAVVMVVLRVAVD